MAALATVFPLFKIYLNSKGHCFLGHSGSTNCAFNSTTVHRSPINLLDTDFRSDSKKVTTRSMPTAGAISRDPRFVDEDSDSSDGTNPPTPKKQVGDKSNNYGSNHTSLKASSNVQGSPLTSPTKPVVPSPKRNLFSRPSKMSVKTDAKESQYARDSKDHISPTSPAQQQHYFSSYQIDSAGLQNSAPSSFSSLIKQAGNHVPHPHIHSKPSLAGGPGSSYSGPSRGRSFDLLRLGNPAGDATGHPPISPSFFANAGRSASFANLDVDDNWPLICARVLPLFNGEGLRQPIEDLNRLVSAHLRRIVERHEEGHLLEDITELFETGIRSLDNNLAAMTDEKLITRLSEIWVFYFSTVLSHLEATFLPVTVELANNASPYLPESGNANMSIHSIACKSYRDILIIPLHTRLSKIFSQLPVLLNISSTTHHHSGNEVFSRMLQCISVLRRVQSNDENQRTCDALGQAVLFRRAKGRGDRRGIIGMRSSALATDGPESNIQATSVGLEG